MTDRNIVFDDSAENVFSPGEPLPGEPTHLAIHLDAVPIKLFINGKPATRYWARREGYWQRRRRKVKS